MSRFISILLTVYLIQTASISASPFSFGGKGGFSLFTFYGEDALSLENATAIPRKAFNASLFFRTRYNNHISGQLECLLVRKGYHQNFKYQTAEFNSVDFIKTENQWNELYTIDYVEIPLLLHYSTFSSRTNTLTLYTGPTLSFLYSAKKMVSNNGLRTKIDQNPSTATVDFGITIGIEYRIRVGHGSVLFDLRYSAGCLTTHYPTANDYRINPNARRLDRKNTGIMLMTGYAYDF